MKVKGFIASLMMMMGWAQMGWAQRVILHLSNNQTVEYHVFEVDSITFKDARDNSGGAYLIGNVWDYIQATMENSKLNTYIWDKRPNVMFYNKDYVPQKGGQDWDMYLKCLNAKIHEHDSAYAMVLLTDEAWERAKQKLAPLYKYPNRYEDKVMGDQDQALYRTIADPDSLANLSMEMDIASSLVFNLREQPKDGSYLVNTRGDTLRSTATWDKNSIFNGPRDDAGYGWCCLATEWAYPKEFYFPDVEVEIDAKSFYNTSNPLYYKAYPNSRTISYNTPIFSEIADNFGHVSNNDFFYLCEPGPTTNPHVEIKLTNNIMSGIYDIYVVMVPNWYRKLEDEEFARRMLYDQAFADSVSAVNKMTFTTQFRYNVNNGNGRDAINTKSTFEYDGSKVDTIKVFENFVFPYSYKNLRYTYPTMILEGATKSKTYKQGFIYSLCIDRIILKSKEEE